MNRTSAARAAVLAFMLSALPGCFVGALVESYRENSTRTVEAKYKGLEGKSFAVVVTATPGIEAEQPGLVGYVTERVTGMLARAEHNTGATHFVQPADVLRFIYNTPGWEAKPMPEVSAELGGVDALVYIEITGFRLNDPGNQYTWDGLATGTVGVFDLTSTVPNEYAYRETIQVDFPDKRGQGPETFSRAVVSTELARRFVDRASWPFFDHEEPYYPEY